MTVPPKWIRKPTEECKLCYSDIADVDDETREHTDDDRSCLFKLAQSEWRKSHLQVTRLPTRERTQMTALRSCTVQNKNAPTKMTLRIHQCRNTDTEIDEGKDLNDPDYEYKDDGYADNEYIDDEYEEDWKN
ncbi:hypothetical protein NEOLEDRAFT_1175291 [Neolentinus lepideus HHB14362 ss-1]|uniref:Uncharacterized protein n=1 Tax=Neolentinus lepideus HHB14362 ss-1 TaxID=1314782 RepID=A0A165V019_9AGAM|nr:hypothetical protein NEOLEDRAFT_1175291 [Neolentinus lepideus HHB14362 ss-1]